MADASGRQTVDGLIREAKHQGVVDAYGFAEWMVQVIEHYGPVENMEIEDMEMSYETAMGVWNGFHGVRV